MSIILNDNIKVNAGKPSEAKYLNGSNVAFSSVSDVNSSVPIAERHLGLTVLINTGTTNVEYWWKDDVNDDDLIEKKFSSEQVVGDFVTGGTNLGFFSGYTGIQTLDLSGTGFGSNIGVYSSELNWYYADANGIIQIGSESNVMPLRRTYVNATGTKSWVWNVGTAQWEIALNNVPNSVGELIIVDTHTDYVFTNTEWDGSDGNVSASVTAYGSLTTGNTVTIANPIYNDKDNQDLTFRTIISDSPDTLNVSYDDDYVRISGITSINSGTNVGTGTEILSGVTGTSLIFKTLVPSGNTNIIEGNDGEIIIYSDGSGDGGTITGAENLEGGSGLIYSGITGTSMQFRSLLAGENTTITTSGNTITFDSKEVFSEDFVITLNDDDVTFGKYLNGDTVPAMGLTANEVIIMAYTEDPPPAPPTASLSSNNNNVEFGEENKEINLVFSYSINEPDAEVDSVLLEAKRENDIDWRIVSTNILATSFQDNIDDSSDRFNTDYIDYRYTVVDTSGYTVTKTHTVNPEEYVTPSVNTVLMGDVTSPETQTLRENGNVNSNVSGVITSNNDLVNINSWTLERRYDDGEWIILSSDSGLDSQLVNISVINDNTVPPSADDIDYRITYVDEYTSGSGGYNTITFNNVNYAGISSEASLDSSGIIGLGNVAWANSIDKTITYDTDLSEYAYYAYPSSLNDISLITMLDNGVGSPITIYTSANGGAFFKFSNTIQVVNGHGVSVEYKLYRSNANGAFSTDVVTFS